MTWRELGAILVRAGWTEEEGGIVDLASEDSGGFRDPGRHYVLRLSKRPGVRATTTPACTTIGRLPCLCWRALPLLLQQYACDPLPMSRVVTGLAVARLEGRMP